MGLFISVFYVAPPVKLKHRGLGEPGVFIVWGPLMIGGAYYVTTGVLEPWVLVASLPYAILVTCVLMGKHIDKFEADTEKGIHTLPVMMGKDRAGFLTQELMVSFFVLVLILVMLGTLGVWTLLCFLALPKLWRTLKIYNKPKPDLASLVRGLGDDGHPFCWRLFRARVVAERLLPGSLVGSP